MLALPLNLETDVFYNDSCVLLLAFVFFPLSSISVFFFSKCAVKLFTLFSQVTFASSFYVCFYKVRLEWPLRSSLLYSQDPPNYYARAVVQTMF